MEILKLDSEPRVHCSTFTCSFFDLSFHFFIILVVVISLNRAEKVTFEQRIVAIKSAHVLSIDFDSYLIAWLGKV